MMKTLTVTVVLMCCVFKADGIQSDVVCNSATSAVLTLKGNEQALPYHGCTPMNTKKLKGNTGAVFDLGEECLAPKGAFYIWDRGYPLPSGTTPDPTLSPKPIAGDYSSGLYAFSCSAIRNGTVDPAVKATLKAINIQPTLQTRKFLVIPGQDPIFMYIFGSAPPRTMDPTKIPSPAPTTEVNIGHPLYMMIYGGNHDPLIPIECTASRGTSATVTLWKITGSQCQTKSALFTRIHEYNASGHWVVLAEVTAFEFTGGSGNSLTFTCKVRHCENLNTDGQCKKDNVGFQRLLDYHGYECDETRRRRSSGDNYIRDSSRVHTVSATVMIKEDVFYSSASSSWTAPILILFNIGLGLTLKNL